MTQKDPFHRSTLHGDFSLKLAASIELKRTTEAEVPFPHQNEMPHGLSRNLGCSLQDVSLGPPTRHSGPSIGPKNGWRHEDGREIPYTHWARNSLLLSVSSSSPSRSEICAQPESKDAHRERRSKERENSRRHDHDTRLWIVARSR